MSVSPPDSLSVNPVSVEKKRQAIVIGAKRRAAKPNAVKVAQKQTVQPKCAPPVHLLGKAAADVDGQADVVVDVKPRDDPPTSLQTHLEQARKRARNPDPAGFIFIRK